MIFLNRFTGRSYGQDCVVSVGHGCDIVDGFPFASTTPQVARVFAHWTLERRLCIGDRALDNNFRRGWNQQIGGLALHDLHWLAEIGARIFVLADERWQRHATNERQEGFATLRQCKRRWLSNIVPHLVNDADVLIGIDDTCHLVLVDEHDPGDGPVRPFLVRTLYDDRAQSVEVAATISVMNQRSRELEQVHVITEPNVFLAGCGLYRLGRNTLSTPCLNQGLDHFLSG